MNDDEMRAELAKAVANWQRMQEAGRGAAGALRVLVEAARNARQSDPDRP